VVKSNDKKRARLNAMRYVLHSLPYTGKDVSASARWTTSSSAAPTSFTSAVSTI
jgi:Uncharacterized conserved protein